MSEFWRFLRSRRTPTPAVPEQKAPPAPAPRVQKLDYTRHDIRLIVDSDVERTSRLNACAKEPGTVAWIEENLRAGDVLYDVGANVGAYAILAAKAINLEGRILAFEPSHLNFGKLVANVILNCCEPAVVPLPFALTATSRLDWFRYASLEVGGSLHTFGEPVDWKGERFQPTVSLAAAGFDLDSLTDLLKLPPPTLMKLDVDGNELEILEGAARVLRRPELRSVLIEVNERLPELTARQVHILAGLGLRLVEKHHLTKGLYNYIFHRAAAASDALVDPSSVPITRTRAA